MLWLCAAVLAAGYHQVTTPTPKAVVPSTIVTAYVKIPSKHSHTEYVGWIKNILSLQDAMVIFTTADMVPLIQTLRGHARNRTHIVTITLQETVLARRYNIEFWKAQHRIDPEQNIHRDFRLYWIWGETSNFLKKAVVKNPFRSKFFAWFDIGYFRTTQFNNQLLIRRAPPTLSSNQVLMLDVSSLGSDEVGAGFIGGYAEAIHTWSKKYYALIHKNRHRFIGKEQDWMGALCKEGLCVLVQPDQNHGDPWFYMAPFMNNLVQVTTD